MIFCWERSAPFAVTVRRDRSLFSTSKFTSRQSFWRCKLGLWFDLLDSHLWSLTSKLQGRCQCIIISFADFEDWHLSVSKRPENISTIQDEEWSVCQMHWTAPSVICRQIFDFDKDRGLFRWIANIFEVSSEDPEPTLQHGLISLYYQVIILMCDRRQLCVQALFEVHLWTSFLIDEAK